MKQIFAIVLALLLAVAGSRAIAQTGPKPYAINVILTLTGFAANVGADEETSFKAFETYANQHGGLRGQPIHFVFYDDQGQPAVAVQLLNTILEQHPAVVLGTSLAGQVQAMAPLIEKDGPVLYGITPNLFPPKGGYLFSAGASTPVITAAVLNYYRARGLTKIAVLVTSDASGQNNVAAIQAALNLPEGKGMSIVDTETFGASDISVAAQAVRIKASGAQVVAALANGTAFGTSLHGLADAGVAVPVYTSAANFTPSLLNSMKSYLPDELDATAASFMNHDRPANDPLRAPINTFYTALAAAGVTQPTAGHAFAWDPATIVLTALNKVGPNATPAQLRDAIDTINHLAGVSGIYDFSSGDRHGLTVDSQLVLKNDKANPGRVIVVSRQGGAPL